MLVLALVVREFARDAGEDRARARGVNDLEGLEQAELFAVVLRPGRDGVTRVRSTEFLEKVMERVRLILAAIKSAHELPSKLRKWWSSPSNFWRFFLLPSSAT